MPDVERRATVGLDADTAFDRLALPARLPLWLVGIRLDEAYAVDGDPSLQDQGEAAPTAPAARFVADRKTRRIEWAAPSGEYSGSLEVQRLLPGMSAVTIRLTTRDAVDTAAAERALAETAKAVERALTRD